MEDDIFRTESLFYEGDSSEDETLQGFIADLIAEKRGQRRCFEYYGISRVVSKLHSDCLVDTIDNDYIHFFYGTSMCNRSRINDILLYHNYLIVLTRKGACQVLDSHTHKRHMFLNPTKFDIVQTVFLNHTNGELLLVTYRPFDNQNILQCRSIPFEAIIEKDISKGRLLFSNDLFFSPSYFEFDEFNNVIVTFCAHKQEYKLWNLQTYSFMYSITDKHVNDIRLGNGLLLIAQETQVIPDSSLRMLPIIAINLHSGSILYRANLFLHSQNEVEFLEVFEEYVFIKQRGHRLVIFSMLKNKVMQLETRSGLDARLIVFLNYQGLFLLFSRHSIDIYNSKLQRIHSLPKNTKYADNTYDNIAYVSSNQDVLVCYYCDSIRTGKVEIYDLLTGERYFSRDSRSENPSDNYALEDVSSVSYDFERNILYTGTRAGLLHIWSIPKSID